MERLADGREVRTHRVGRAPGVVLDVMDLGATIRRLEVTGGDGLRRNVALGHGSAQEYVEGRHYLGAVVGRYANRIAQGRFVLDGAPVRVSVNDRGNHLHGGVDGFHRRVWTVTEAGEQHVELSLVSPDGDQGFPGALSVAARYEVDADTVSLLLAATCDAVTIVNLTSHVYLNLDGEGACTIDDHVLTVQADSFLPVDATGIPLGEAEPVDGTPFDLRQPTRLAAAERSAHPQLSLAPGFDHTWVLDRGGEPAATLVSPQARLRVDLFSNQPGLQVYTGGGLAGVGTSTTGAGHVARAGVALEPQKFPDSPNQPTFPSAVLHPGEVYSHRLNWRFSHAHSLTTRC